MTKVEEYTSKIVAKSELLAEVELAYKSKLKPSERTKITCSTDIYTYLTKIYGDNIAHVEYFYVILLNRANHVLGWNIISKGGVAGTVADPKIILQAALLANASSIILAHNHPSGNTKPSSADIQLTKKVKQAGEFMDMPILDHVILTEEGYYSFADEGIL
ncbi:JAB domain-containing protein [Pontibacter mangrovi]|uniref:DNA repair protein n=1 Tax=Pontibacter mangrovi TaxID=2589816 RepID=A0A501W2Z1_9BACT|nr:JAB domain-containing protein [Pontibacter mangrovi]TPE43979.1 DNA repair protein [Pontibacter mangrovi]